jgi:AraC-like DNA-binding protein
MIRADSSPGLRGIAGTFAPSDGVASSATLANVVESITDWNISSAEAARDTIVQVFPSTATYLIVQYGTPIRSYRSFNGTDYQHPPYKHVATRVDRGVVVIRPAGPVGLISVRVRPEATARLVGGRLHDFADVKISLDKVFCPSHVASLAEMLTDASSSRERFTLVRHFLLANLREGNPDQVACSAAARLRGDPSLRVRRLAADLGISERHLSRRFRSMFGTGLKGFARAARVEKIVAARRGGSSWADVAYTCGFADQAHMINDFSAIIGAPPDRAFCDDCLLAW